jgi:hypothetical protein
MSPGDVNHGNATKSFPNFLVDLHILGRRSNPKFIIHCLKYQIQISNLISLFPVEFHSYYIQ